MPLSPDVQALVEPFISGARRGPIAFDADGTLWAGDIGEDLLRHVAAERYPEYERRVAVDPADGFAFAAAALAGWDESKLIGVCRRLFSADRIFPFMRSLLPKLRDVWIVSASPIWPVLAGAELLGIPRERVVAVEVKIEGGRLRGEVRRPVPTLEGKVLGLAAKGIRPVLAAGNSTLDIPLLCAAERAFVVAPHGDETEIVHTARERGWPIQRG